MSVVKVLLEKLSFQFYVNWQFISSSKFIKPIINFKAYRYSEMEAKHLDRELMEDMAEGINLITHSGQKTMDQSILKKIKNICKKSDKYVEQAYDLIIRQIEKNHSEIRYSAFQLCDELFRKSHCFRSLVVANMQYIFELVAETNPDNPLPAPRARALELKAMSLKAIDKWHQHFGPGYKKLVIGYKYLQQCKKVDFASFEIADAATRAQNAERERRLRVINEERKKKTLLEVKDMEPEIRSSIISLKNCINLILPEPEEFFINDNDLVEESDDKQNLKVRTKVAEDGFSEEPVEEDGDSTLWREVGMANVKHSIQLHIIPNRKIEIEETSENSPILENAKEIVKLINNRYLPSVLSWLQVLTIVSDNNAEIKQLLDLKIELEGALKKYNDLKVSSKDEVSTDSELEEVDDDSETEPMYSKKFTNIEDSSVWSIQSTPLQTSKSLQKMQTNCQRIVEEPQPSTSSGIVERKQKLLSIAPKLPFDVDLYHWEDEHLPTPTMLPVNAEGSRFWASTCDELNELAVPEGSTSLRTRVIEFTGKFEPITHICRAPLPSGKLCPRKDKFKCPFHGEIVPRDETGKCINPEDAERMALLAEKQQQETPDWQDPVLLKEIEAQTGLDLKMPEKKGKCKKVRQKFPGLTDVKAKQNTSTSRLYKKVFKRSTMKKVATSLDKFDHRRFKDKYGDNFNYMFDR